MMTGPFDLTGRVAVVTGANIGIGLGMALRLVAAGAKIAEAGVEAMAIEADVVQEDDCRGLIGEGGTRFGRLDRGCHVMETTTRSRIAVRNLKRPRRPRATWSSPRRVARDAIELI
jgi:NAD(P)-dependent dehydrogenase (short-subunit alcohol dehydrogenase family)